MHVHACIMALPEGGGKMHLQEEVDNCLVKLELAVDFEFYKALFEPVRSEIVKCLAVRGPQSIKEIAANFSQDRSVISRHLEFMHRCKIVNKVKAGRSVIYDLNCEEILKKFEATVDSLKMLI